MTITDVRIRKTPDSGKMKAVASFTIDGVFVIHDVKVIVRNEGTPFIAMPSRKRTNGEFSDIVHPINQDTRDYITQTILIAYEAMAE